MAPSPSNDPARVESRCLPEGAVTAIPLLYTQSDSFVALLHQLDASLWVTTYQAQQLLVLRARGDSGRPGRLACG
jgi:hypothetical protein